MTDKTLAGTIRVQKPSDPDHIETMFYRAVTSNCEEANDRIQSINMEIDQLQQTINDATAAIEALKLEKEFLLPHPEMVPLVLHMVALAQAKDLLVKPADLYNDLLAESYRFTIRHGLLMHTERGVVLTERGRDVLLQVMYK